MFRLSIIHQFFVMNKVMIKRNIFLSEKKLDKNCEIQLAMQRINSGVKMKEENIKIFTFDYIGSRKWWWQTLW